MGTPTHTKSPDICQTAISGCLVIKHTAAEDARGSFVKHYREERFREAGLEMQFPEEFFTRSTEGVLRGIHFTIPPIDQVKVVTCVSGSVLDAVIDLRKDSPTFGQHVLFELNADRPESLYIGKGMGHAFYVPSGEALLLYRVSTSYIARFDAGIRWDSAGIDWPVTSPIVSERDRRLPSLNEFVSPFCMQGGE